MESVLLKFGLYLVVVVDDVSTFKGVSFRWVNCLTYEFTNKFFTEAAMTLAYTWNLIHVDGTGIVCDILAISRLLWFPIDVSFISLPKPIDDVAKATVSYIRQIKKDSRF